MISLAGTDVGFAWLAGIVEGEGCINTHTTHKYRGGEHRTYRYPQVRVRMTDADVVAKCHEVAESYGGGLYGPYKPPSHKEHYKHIYQWTITGEPCRRLLRHLLPYFGERRRAEAERAMA